MTPPYYTITVTNLTRGWSYDTTEGDTPSDLDDVQLVDPFVYAWQFAGDVLPSYLNPLSAAVNFAAKSASLVPETQIGDLITLDVRTGTDGPRVIDPPPMRVTEASVTLIRDRYPARLAVAMADMSVDWRGRSLIGQAPPPPGEDWSATMRRAWRERLAEYGYLLGIPVGAPDTWDGHERPAHPFDSSIDALVLNDYPGYGNAGYPGNALEAFVRTLNAHHPGGLIHVPVAYYGPGHPSGYEYVGPSTWSTATGAGAIAEPDSDVKIELVPVSRTVDTLVLPLEFDVVDGILTLVPVEPPFPSTDAMTQVALDACWCVLPVDARRSREAVVNAVHVSGQVGVDTAPSDFDTEDGEYELVDTADAAARGTSQRDVALDLYLGNRYLFNTNTYPVPWPAVEPAMLPFLSDESAREAPWTYDAFEVRSSLIPDGVSDWLLPLLAPRLPGETDGDGRLVRHVTVFNVAGDKRFDGMPVRGFVVGGVLTIAGGEMVWNLSTVPGDPVPSGADPTPVTVADVDAASYEAHPVADIDPLITVADLAYVAA